MRFHELANELDLVFQRLAAVEATVSSSGVIFLSLMADRVVLEHPDMDANSVRKIMALAVGFAQVEEYPLDHRGLDSAVTGVKYSFRNCDETDPPDCWTNILERWDYYTTEFPAIDRLAEQLNIEGPSLFYGQESLEW